MALYLREEEIRQLLTMAMAVEAVESAHRSHAQGMAQDVPRSRIRNPRSALHILQGGLAPEGVMGYKAYTTSREGNRFLVHLFDAGDGRPLAVMEADFLGMMRTGAVGGVAARWLAREDARVAGVFGSGWQARGQIEALCLVKKLERIKVFARDADKLARFCADMSARTGCEVMPARDARDAVAGSDIVATITTAATPLFDGDWLEPGCHVNAAGSNALIRRELDEKAVRRAGLVCVDSRAVALKEAGDLLPPLEKGRLTEGALVELGEIIAGFRPGRTDARQITLFESQGMAIQDLALASRLLAKAREQGLGTELPY
ncbi:MAG: ornithine cyclodeaminase family protein [Rhodocyclaceae bacterium]|nr:ornithine cyclodeaminase family protein [Rhodocyclaceae bacterium]